MNEQSISDYVRIGIKLRYLQDVKAGYAVSGANYVLSNIKVFLSDLERFELPVTRRFAHDLHSIQEELSSSKPDKLTEAQALRIKKAAKATRDVLRAELQGRVVFVVSDKRWGAEKLLENVSGFFAAGAFDLLPELAQFDFMEAGKCVAFERPTAAAFHLLRGTESTLRQYYKSYVRRNRIAILNWGNIVTDLRRKRKPPPAVLLNHLDNIRHHYRNPTQHPEKTYSLDEAQDLFNLCVEVVNRMTRSEKWSKEF